MLVTGADGFTGAHFVKQAREAGYEVFEFNAPMPVILAVVVGWSKLTPTKLCAARL